MSSKKSFFLLILTVVVFVLLLCAAYMLIQRDDNSNQRDGSFDYTDSSGTYTAHVSYSLKNLLFNGLIDPQTQLSFVATISGTKEDIENIEAFSPMTNTGYRDLMLENGPYDIEYIGNDMKITGNLLFDMKEMTKEGVNVIDIFYGVEIYDKDGNEYMIYFNFS